MAINEPILKIISSHIFGSRFTKSGLFIWIFEVNKDSRHLIGLLWGQPIEYLKSVDGRFSASIHVSYSAPQE